MGFNDRDIRFVLPIMDNTNPFYREATSQGSKSSAHQISMRNYEARSRAKRASAACINSIKLDLRRKMTFRPR